MRINLAVAVIILIISGFSGLSQTIIPGGFVSGTWDSNGNPYLIEAPITIHRDSALYIEAGCVLQFYNSAYLKVEGYINATGNAEDSIFFTSYESAWLGIRLEYVDTSYQGNLLFQYCSFNRADGGTTFPDGGALSVKDRHDVTIFNSSFYNNYANEKGGAIYLENADIQLKKVCFSNNSTGLVLSEGKGGAMYVIDSDYIFEELSFVGNRSSVAGAMYSNNTDLDLRECSFINNSSHSGGGALVCHKSGVLLVDRCTFDGNVASGSGGAIALLEAINAYFRDCTIINNTSESDLFLSDGGGIMVTAYDNEVDFYNCNISNNDAGDYGGGLYSISNTTIVGCLFHANQAELDDSDGGGGGAICIAQSNDLILNSTFSANTSENGSTILCEDAFLSLVNTILWDDTISADPKIYLDQRDDPTSIYVSSCDIEGGVGVIRGSGDYEIDWADDNFREDPRFNSMGSDFFLSNESPCINAGRMDIYTNLLPLLDLAGNPRVFRDTIDLGCYENQFPFGIPDKELQSELLIYPNPAREYFYVRNEGTMPFNGSFTISDLSGRMLSSRAIYLGPKERISESCSGLPEGMYMLRLSDGNYNTAFKLLIQD